MLAFAAPMIMGNLLQQCYNLADTWVVGRFIGADALGAVGSAYTLMTFLTSIIIGLCMGSGALCSYYHGQQNERQMKNSFHIAFVLIGAAALAITIVVRLALTPVLRLLQTPEALLEMMHEYCAVVFLGIVFIFLYNYFSFLLRSIGDSVTPLIFLAIAAVLNIFLDLYFVCLLDWGVSGAAWATVIAQGVSGAGLALFTWAVKPALRLHRQYFAFSKAAVREVAYFSAAASVQQSVMNFGILMIQGLVNSFGTAVMAAFAAAVKIDTLAYMPAQEFGNAYSLFVSQNFGAGEKERIRRGSRSAAAVSVLFCAIISVCVCVLAGPLMRIFISAGETEILAIGMQYLRIEGAFYIFIGILFLLYGYYRGINRPEMALLLTVLSLGTRVVLAYVLAGVPAIGIAGIWWAIPIGWFVADAVGIACRNKRVSFPESNETPSEAGLTENAFTSGGRNAKQTAKQPKDRMD